MYNEVKHEIFIGLVISLSIISFVILSVTFGIWASSDINNITFIEFFQNGTSDIINSIKHIISRIY